jgi:hypothetical protein
MAFPQDLMLVGAALIQGWWNLAEQASRQNMGGQL